MNNMENLTKLITKLGGLKTEEEIGLYNSIVEEINKTNSSLLSRDTPKKVKQYTEETSYQHDEIFGICLNCGKDEIEYKSNYCPHCGQKLYWEKKNGK